MRVVGQGAFRFQILSVDTNGAIDTSNNAITNNVFSSISGFDSFVRFSAIFLGPDSTPPIIGAPSVPGGIFLRGAGKNISSTIFDSSAIAEYDTISLYADTRGVGGAPSGYGYRQILGTTSDTGKTRAYAFAISNSMVGAGETLVYYIRSTDTRGNSVTSASAETPAQVGISGGLSARIFAGPGSPEFATDSQELVNGLWRDTLGVSRAYITLFDTTLPIRIRVIELSGFAETAVLYQVTGFGPVKVGETILVGGIGQIDTTLTLSNETNYVLVVIGDTNLVFAAISDTGLLFQESVRPIVVSPDSIINSGGALSDTTRVILNFGATGGRVTDTNPNGMKYYSVSETTPSVSLAFAESAAFTIPDTAINPATGIATLFFSFEDDAGNSTDTMISDTILVDLFPPVISVTSPGLRAKNVPITVAATLVDTASGVASARLYARHLTTTGTTYISIPMTMTGGTTNNGTWTGTISDTIVGNAVDTGIGLEFYLACTDVVGRGAAYRSAVAPDTIGIIAGMSFRTYAGPADDASFSTDSQQLIAGVWQPDSEGRSVRNALTLNMTVLPGIRIRIIDYSLLADTASIFLNGAAVASCTVFVAGVGQVDFPVNFNNDSNNPVVITLFDTGASGASPVSDTGVIFIDMIPVVVDTPGRLLFAGANFADTIRIPLTLGNSGGGARDTNPNGIFQYLIADTANTGFWDTMYTNKIQAAFVDSVYINLNSFFINPANGLATVFFTFRDDADNDTTAASDTIIIDLLPPVISVTSPGLRAKNVPITISSTLVDTASGVAIARLYARHQTTTGTTYITIPMTMTGGTANNGTWTGTISDTIVGNAVDTGIGLEFYLACTDVVGRGAAYRSSVSPDTISIISGLAMRAFVGSQFNFAVDSKELTASQWMDSSATRAYLVLDTSMVDALVRVTELTGLGDTFRISIDTGAGYITSQDSFFVNGAGEISFSGLQFSQETNFIRIEVADTAYVIPLTQDTGKIFVDFVRPAVARQDSIINSGGMITDTNGVILSFGATGGKSSDTGPLGIRAFFVSDTAGLIGAEIGTEFLYSDTRGFFIPTSLIDPVSGIATLYYHVQDYAGNYSFQASDTILVDLVTPLIRTGNGGNISSLGQRAKGQPIIVTANIIDSGGVASATLYAKHRADTGNYQAFTMSFGSGTSQDGVWTGTIPTSIVGAVADTTIGVEYYLACTDVVGRTSRYKDSATPESISIVNGQSGRIFVGPDTVNFNADSRELISGFWLDSGIAVTYNAVSDSIPSVRIRVLESTGLGDSISVYVDTSAAGTSFVRMADTVIPTGSGQAFLTFTVALSQETNWVKVVIFDTAGLIPDYIDQGRIFLDPIAPSIARSDSLIRGITDAVTFPSSGEILTNTRTVQLDFRVAPTGGSVIETGPLGMRYFYVSPDGSDGQRYAFADTFAYTVSDTDLNLATNVATLNFRFEDQAGNLSIQVPDTILVDLDSPAILGGNGGNIGNIGLRAKGQSIAISAYVADTGGVSQVAIFARHRNDTPTYGRIPMTLSSGTFKFGVWSGTIPDTIVGALADTTFGVEYYLACTDIVGRTGIYKSAAAPESISIVNGLAMRAFVGSQLNFAVDSKELTAGQWADSSAMRAYFVLDTTSVDALVRVTESTGLGDTFRISIDTGAGYITSQDSFFVNGAGEISFSGLQFSQETNLIRIEVADTAYVIPLTQDTGRVFVDLVRPAIVRQDSIINNGGVIADTNGVVLNFGATGGQSSDTGPLGIRAFFVSDTPGLIGAEIGTEFLYSDTRAFAIPTSFIDTVSGIATLYFHVQDYAGNYSFQGSDTILVDTIAPIILTGNGGNIGNIGIRAKGQAITVNAYVSDSGGLATVTLFARHRNDTVSYLPIAMSVASGDARFGVWTGTIPTTIVGAIADTAIGVEFYVACTDVVGRTGIYKSAATPESIGIVNGVDGRVYVRNAQGETTEVTGSTLITSTGGQLTLRITSTIGDTIQIFRVPVGGAGTQYLAYQPNFGDTTIFLAGAFSNFDSVVVVIYDTLVAIPFAETYSYFADVTKPAITAFTLDPIRTAVDSTGVYVKVTFSAAEQNVRLFISQSPDTFLGALNDTTARYTGTTIDSTLGMGQIKLSAFAGDTAVLYASAWDQAGNVADTVLLTFVLDRAGPLVSVTAIANNRPISESVTVSATITDTTLGLGLQSVQLGVKLSGTTDTYSMTAIGAGSYRATIPGSKLSTSGTVTWNVTAKDTFGQLGNASSTFTVSAVVLRIADSAQSFAAMDTVFAQAVLGYVQLNAPGDTVRVTNVTSGVSEADTLATNTGAATDSPMVPVPLVAGANRVTITRISAAGDSQTYTRWFVSDTTAPSASLVTLDSGAPVTGDTSVVLTFSSNDAFGVAAYQITGDITESSATFIGYNGAATLYRTVTLTSASGFKSCTVVVRDSAGNVSAAVTDSIELAVGLGTVFTPVYDAPSGETRANVPRTMNDAINETVTILQGMNDSVVTYIDQTGANGDTIRLLIDFADTVRNTRIIISVPDTASYALSDSTLLISDFAAGVRTLREITVSDSIGNNIGGAPEMFNRIRMTWSLDSALVARKSSLEIFFFDTVTRRWLIARSDSRVVDQNAIDSYLNYPTGDTISIVFRHFTLYAAFPAGGFTQTNVSNIVIFPNPYVPYDGNLANGEAGQGMADGIYIGNIPTGSSVDIYDIRGHLIDAMSSAEVAASTNGLVRWDARNRDRQEVASGVYLIVVKGAGGTAVRKVAVVR